MIVRSFPPIIDSNCISLFLGTVPGETSLGNNKYFHDKSNHFWELMAYALNENKNSKYEERTQMLLSNKIGLWDVLRECNRFGSKDINIKNEKPNDLISFLNEYSNIKTIFLIGGYAVLFFRKYFKNIIQLKTVNLTSSSGANDREIPYHQLIDEWEQKIKMNHGK